MLKTMASRQQWKSVFELSFKPLTFENTPPKVMNGYYFKPSIMPFEFDFCYVFILCSSSFHVYIIAEKSFCFVLAISFT